MALQVTRQEVAICVLMMKLIPQIKKLEHIAKDEDLGAILTDAALKWVRSSKCPAKHKEEFFKVAHYVSGAAQALNVCVVEFVGHLLDEDDNDDAAVIGAVAKYAKKWRQSEE